MAIECDRCGACCCTFPIFASDSDVVLEPKIKASSLELAPWLGDQESRYKLFPLPFLDTCAFLGSDSLCSIYQTRPAICRRFEAGSPQCQQARKSKGLPILS